MQFSLKSQFRKYLAIHFIIVTVIYLTGTLLLSFSEIIIAIGHTVHVAIAFVQASSNQETVIVQTPVPIIIRFLLL